MNYRVRVLDLSAGKERELFRQSVFVPDGVLFPFDKLVEVLRLLFPKCSSVEINCML